MSDTLSLKENKQLIDGVESRVSVLEETSVMGEVLSSSLGTNEDLSSPTGSVHAKLKDIKNDINTTNSIFLPVPFGVELGNKTISGRSTDTILDISGKGILKHFMLRSSAALTLKIIADGVQIFDTKVVNGGYVSVNLLNEAAGYYIQTLAPGGTNQSAPNWQSFSTEKIQFGSRNTIRELMIGDGIGFRESLKITVTEINNATSAYACFGFGDIL